MLCYCVEEKLFPAVPVPGLIRSRWRDRGSQRKPPETVQLTGLKLNTLSPCILTAAELEMEFSRLLARSLTALSSTLEEMAFSKKSLDAILNLLASRVQSAASVSTSRRAALRGGGRPEN